MRHSFRDADFTALTDSWNAFYPPEFSTDPELLRLNTEESLLFDWGASAYEEFDGKVAGFVAIKKSANPTLYGGPELDQAHLTSIAFRDPQLGLELLAEAKTVLRDRGVGSLIFGQDSRHFFPGCPMEMGALLAFLMVEGFVGASEPCDVARDLAVCEFTERAPVGAVVRKLRVEDRPALEKFMSEEFPGRWRFDVLHKFRVESPGCVIGLFVEGSLKGFALVQNWSHKEPIGGGVWRKSLGQNWGSLGPIGVAKSLRGKGYGNALLGCALMLLKGEGVRRCIIDWTVLFDFYGRHGFEVIHRYRALSLKLD